MLDLRELQVFVAPPRLLEGYRACQNAPVDFGQRDMHRQVGGRKPARRGRPSLGSGSRQHDLQHRRVGFVENAAAALVEARRKGGGVENDVELFAPDQLAQGRAHGGVLEAGDVRAGYREAARFERICERVDRGKVVGEVDRAIEDGEGAYVPLSRSSRGGAGVRGSGGGRGRGGGKTGKRRGGGPGPPPPPPSGGGGGGGGRGDCADP